MQIDNNLEIINTIDIIKTPRVVQLSGIYDIEDIKKSTVTYKVDTNIGDDWNIGLITGPSGSGKTTLSKKLFADCKIVTIGQGYDWDENKSIIDSFDSKLSIKDILSALSSVGFNSPPSWLRPYRLLSTGEQFRTTIARSILDESHIIVIDEYTSVVDRTVAKIGSAAIAKAIRKANKKIVCVTCHEDVLDWLDPDWVIHMPEGTCTRRLLRQRPEISIEIRKCDKRLWERFRRYHYLSTNIMGSAKAICAIYKNEVVAFASCLVLPHPTHRIIREHRTVCLPDYQGVGIGNALSNYLASIVSGLGLRYTSVTTNPSMIHYRLNSKDWQAVNPNKLYTKQGGKKRWKPNFRKTVSFRYVGEKNFEGAKKIGFKI